MTLIVCVPKNGNNNFRVGTSVIFIFFVLKDMFIWLSDKQLPYFTDYRSIGRIAAFRQNFWVNTKIGRGCR